VLVLFSRFDLVERYANLQLGKTKEIGNGK